MIFKRGKCRVLFWAFWAARGATADASRSSLGRGDATYVVSVVAAPAAARIRMQKSQCTGTTSLELNPKISATFNIICISLMSFTKSNKMKELRIYVEGGPVSRGQFISPKRLPM